MARRDRPPIGAVTVVVPLVDSRAGDAGGWRVTDRRVTADALTDVVGVAREAYERFQEAWGEVGRVMRALDEWQWQRVDAYPGWEGTRDVGAGVDMLGWMTEVEERADEIRSEADEASASAPQRSDTVAGDEQDRALYDDVMAELARGTHVGNLDRRLVERARAHAERRSLPAPPDGNGS